MNEQAEFRPTKLDSLSMAKPFSVSEADQPLLKNALRLSGFTQQQIGDQVEVSQAFISGALSGVRITDGLKFNQIIEAIRRGLKQKADEKQLPEGDFENKSAFLDSVIEKVINSAEEYNPKNAVKNTFNAELINEQPNGPLIPFLSQQYAIHTRAAGEAALNRDIENANSELQAANSIGTLIYTIDRKIAEIRKELISKFNLPEDTTLEVVVNPKNAQHQLTPYAEMGQSLLDSKFANVVSEAISNHWVSPEDLQSMSDMGLLISAEEFRSPTLFAGEVALFKYAFENYEGYLGFKDNELVSVHQHKPEARVVYKSDEDRAYSWSYEELTVIDRGMGKGIELPTEIAQKPWNGVLKPYSSTLFRGLSTTIGGDSSIVDFLRLTEDTIKSFPNLRKVIALQHIKSSLKNLGIKVDFEKGNNAGKTRY
ncbi:MAG TPA: hypothetical protein VLE91_02965 [Candidatus Saccharimonadales bacterium]|nr:hypothetical protein [Candidatus Saccharimonadales bacterium]